MRHAVRTLTLVSCFAVALAAVVGGSISWLRDARLGRPTLVFDYARILGKRLPGLAEARESGLRTIAFLGDSQIVSYPVGETVPDRLQQAAGEEIHVTSLAMPGSGPFDYYCLADRIADTGPDLVVISLNLDHFSSAWRNAYSRPQLAGLIAPERFAEALALPFDWIGLTTDRLLFYTAVVQSGGYDAWYWLTLRQTQVGRARERFERWLQADGDETPEERFKQAVDARTIDRVFTGPDIRHYRTDALLEHYEETLAGIEKDHPVLEALGGTVRRLRAGGARVLVYAAPVELSWIESQGLLGTNGFGNTIAPVAEVVTANGGTFADLHDKLPAEAFRDAPGHLSHPPKGPDGPAQLAELLRPLVLRAANR